MADTKLSMEDLPQSFLKTIHIPPGMAFYSAWDKELRALPRNEVAVIQWRRKGMLARAWYRVLNWLTTK